MLKIRCCDDSTVLVLVAPLPVRGAVFGEGDADRGFNPRDGGANPARRRAPRTGGESARCCPARAPARGAPACCC